MTDPIDPNDLQSGPIRHESLPPDLLEHIRSIYEIVGPYLDTTLEQFEIGFMRDMHPEDEVAIWSCIAAAFVDYHKQHTNNEALPEEDEKKLLGALISISTGVEDVDALCVPPDVGKKLLACYDALGE